MNDSTSFERRLSGLFDRQRFFRDPALDSLIDETESRCSGGWALTDDDLELVSAAGESDPLRALIVAAVLFAPAYALLAWLLSRSEGGKRPEEQGVQFRAGRAFLLILACYVPMLLVTFPGSFAYDVPFQLEQVFTGEY